MTRLDPSAPLAFSEALARAHMKPGLPILSGDLNGPLVFGLQARTRRCPCMRACAMPCASVMIAPGRARHAGNGLARFPVGWNRTANCSAQRGGLLESNALACMPESTHDPEADSVLEVWPLTGQ